MHLNNQVKYMFFIDHINILTLFYKFVTFSINLFLFDHGICYFLMKYSAGNPGVSKKLFSSVGKGKLTQNYL